MNLLTKVIVIYIRFYIKQVGKSSLKRTFPRLWSLLALVFDRFYVSLHELLE